MTQGNGKSNEEESRQALLERLIKVMGMTTSDNDNIALVAARRANDILDKLETDWGKLIKGKVTIIADPFTNIVSPPPSATRPSPSPAPPAATPQPPKLCAHCRAPMPKVMASTRGLDFCSRACLDARFPPPKPKPRYTDRAAIRNCLDSLVGKYIRNQGTKNTLQRIADDFNRDGSLILDDWTFLASTAAKIGSVKVTDDML